jgi:starch phosphorylase
MANLAVVGSHSTNGVAAIHSRLLRTATMKDLADLFPERFNNKTNGITPRRWLLMANPALAGCITEAIGDGWINDLTDLARMGLHVGDLRRVAAGGLAHGGAYRMAAAGDGIGREAAEIVRRR